MVLVPGKRCSRGRWFRKLLEGFNRVSEISSGSFALGSFCSVSKRKPCKGFHYCFPQKINVTALCLEDVASEHILKQRV